MYLTLKCVCDSITPLLSVQSPYILSTYILVFTVQAIFHFVSFLSFDNLSYPSASELSFIVLLLNGIWPDLGSMFHIYCVTNVLLYIKLLAAQYVCAQKLELCKAIERTSDI